MIRPASEPTTVPLMRINCRSRPTCSSMRRLASSASQRSIVSVIIAVISTPYWPTRCSAPRTIQLSTLSRNSASSRSDSPMLTTASAMRVRSALEVSATPSSTSRLRVVQQIIGELEEETGRRPSQLVVRIAANLVGEVHQLAVDAVADEMVDESRRPGRRIALDHALDHLSGVQRPLEGPVGQQLNQSLLPVLGKQRGQHPSHRRTPLRFGDAPHEHPVD